MSEEEISYDVRKILRRLDDLERKIDNIEYTVNDISSKV